MILNFIIILFIFSRVIFCEMKLRPARREVNNWRILCSEENLYLWYVCFFAIDFVVSVFFVLFCFYCHGVNVSVPGR